MAVKRARLIPDGDVQLWVYADRGWEIPICAQPCHVEGGGTNLIAVWPALMMPAEPTQVVTMAMEAREGVKGTGCWVLTNEKFQSCATKCEGITPAFYYRKNGIPVEQAALQDIAVEISEPSAADEVDASSIQRLAKFLAGRTAMFRQADAETVLQSLSNLAVEILIKRMRPIDLGFCVIRAVPLRVGWQALVHNAHPVRPPVSDERLDREILENGLVDVTLHSADLMHTSKSGDDGAIIRWNLEIEWTERGEKEMVMHEHDKLDTHGTTAYAVGHARIVQHLSDAIVALWRSWLRKVSAPRGSVSEIGPHGGQRIGSKRGAGRLNSLPLEQPVLHLGNIEKDWFKRRERLTLHEASSDLPQVSDVQQKSLLLRDAGGDVSTGRGDAEDGVLVPHAPEGGPQDKVLDV